MPEEASSQAPAPVEDSHHASTGGVTRTDRSGPSTRNGSITNPNGLYPFFSERTRALRTLKAGAPPLNGFGISQEMSKM